MDDYFKDWMSVIDRQSLVDVLNKVGLEYRLKPVTPAQVDVFKAFSLCSLKDLKIVMLGQDFIIKL